MPTEDASEGGQEVCLAPTLSLTLALNLTLTHFLSLTLALFKLEAV